MAKSPLALADEKLLTLYDIMDELHILEPNWDAAKEQLYNAHKMLFEYRASTMTLLEGAKKSVLKARVDAELAKRVAKEITEVHVLLERA